MRDSLKKKASLQQNTPGEQKYLYRILIFFLISLGLFNQVLLDYLLSPIVHVYNNALTNIAHPFCTQILISSDTF